MPRSQALSFAIRTRPQARACVAVQTRYTPGSVRQLYRLLYTSTFPCMPPTYRACPSLTPTSKASILHSPIKPTTSAAPISRFQPTHLQLHRHHLTTLSRPPSRPQSPYLSYPLYHNTSFRARLRLFLRNRYLTTARKKRWRDTFRAQLRIHAYFWPMFVAAYMLWYGVQQIELEHAYPTPAEWSFWTRWDGRAGKAILSFIDERGYALGDEWAKAAGYLMRVKERLEPKEDKKVQRRDSRGVRIQEERVGDGPVMVDGLGQVGFDLSMKSERWKQGYWEVLMGLAKVAENVDGMCKRKGAKMESGKEQLFRWENIPGPENPRPVPVKWESSSGRRGVRSQTIPHISEVESVMDAPETFYLRVLTSHGFNSRQRMEAALAYADWCDFKGLQDTAANMYDWALDIAAGGLPEGAGYVVDIQTGVINAGKEQAVSENLLKATTALGVWHAKHGEVKEALPIFLSVLRARKALPAAPIQSQVRASGKKASSSGALEAQTTGAMLYSMFQNFVGFFQESDNSLRISSGDEQPFHSLTEACEEVGIMTYIGEILFATSENEREKGLSWTRDSVEAAEAILWFMDEQRNPDDGSGRQKCRECLQTGLANWQQMTQHMVQIARKTKEETQQSKGWLSGIGKSAALEKATQEVRRWEEEATQIQLRRQKTAGLISPLTNTGSQHAMISDV